MKHAIPLIAFIMAVVAICAATPAQDVIQVKGLSQEMPLTVKARVAADALVLDVDVKKGWHLYERDVGGGQPVSVRLAKDSDFQATGPLVIPASADGKLRDKFRLSLPIKQTGKVGKLKGSFDFMICDPVMCMPPITLTLEGGGAPIRVLLVVGKAEDREKGIGAFLTSRGFACTTTTYAGLTAEECEKHDVVLADSMLFRKFKAKREDAMAFPKSSTPMVGVGFWGTEIIEKHGLAMTAGYI